MYERRAFGKWELCVKPNEDGTCFIPHLSELKVNFEKILSHNEKRKIFLS